MAQAMMRSSLVALLSACASAPAPKPASERPVVDTAAPLPEARERVIEADDLVLGALGRDRSQLPKPTGWFAQPPSTDLVVYPTSGALMVGPLDGPMEKVPLGPGDRYHPLYGTPAADRVLLGAEEGALELWSLAGLRIARWAFPEYRRMRDRSHVTAMTEGAFALRRRDGVVVYRASDGEELWRQPIDDDLLPQTMWLRAGGDELWTHCFQEGLVRWRKGAAEPEVMVPGDEDRYLRGTGVSADGRRWAYVRPAGENRYREDQELVLAEESGAVARWKLSRYTDVERIVVVGESVVVLTDEGTRLYRVAGGWTPMRATGLALEPLREEPILVAQGKGLTSCDPASGRCADEAGHRDAVRSIHVVGDGRWLITAGGDGRVIAWRLDGAEATPTTVVEAPRTPVVAASDFGVAVQATFADGKGDDRKGKAGMVFHPWKDDGLGPRRWHRSVGGFSTLRFDPGGWIVGVDPWGDVSLIDAGTGGLAARLPFGGPERSRYDRPKPSVTVSPDGRWWWAEGRLRRWSLTGGEAVVEKLIPPQGRCRLSNEGRGTCAAVGDGEDGEPALEVTVPGAERGERTWKHALPRDYAVDGFVVGERVQVVALGHYDTPSHVVFRRGGERFDIGLDDRRVTAMALFAGERRLVTGLDDGSLLVWGVPTAAGQSSAR